jgi:ATP-dependent helicase Lhr and Lhr-like helicase
VSVLPPWFERWFQLRGWSVRRHQSDVLQMALARENVLLIAPTGAGKTLAGFLPSLLI